MSTVKVDSFCGIASRNDILVIALPERKQKIDITHILLSCQF